MKRGEKGFVGQCPEMVEHVERPGKEWLAEVEDFAARCRLLAEDIKNCQRPLKRNPADQFWRRGVTRNIFVLIEACAYGLKKAALYRYEHLEVSFTKAELALLAEERYSLDDRSGEAKVDSQNFQRFIPNLKFAFKCIGKTFGTSFALNLGSAPLKECERVRNRIIHPKRLEDLTISDAEIKQIQAVFGWFLAEFCTLLARMETSSVPVRNPQCEVVTQLEISGQYVLFWPDGEVYEFDSKKDAEAHKRAYSVKGEWLPPLIYKSSDLVKGKIV